MTKLKSLINKYKKINLYTLSSFISCIVDIVSFGLINIFLSIIYSTIIARIISSLVNYYLNAKMVFKKHNKLSIIKYYILVIINMLISAYLTEFLTNSFLKCTIVAKIISDIIIFFSNYFIQNKLIFINKEK